MHIHVNYLRLGFMLSLLAAFVLFSMPNLQDRGAYEGETIHSASAHDAANSVKATKRFASPVKLLMITALIAAFFACRLELNGSPYRTPLVKSFFLPVISIRIRLILLRPLKFTSLFV